MRRRETIDDDVVFVIRLSSTMEEDDGDGPRDVSGGGPWTVDVMNYYYFINLELLFWKFHVHILSGIAILMLVPKLAHVFI